MKKIPKGLLGPNRDGVMDPERFTAAERKDQLLDRLAEERDRRASPSPFIRALQAATDKALGRKR